MPSVTPDIGATYRGYRLQALYGIRRVLEADKSRDLRFRPDGLEDLDILEGNELLELVQVKARRARPLTLARIRSFLERSREPHEAGVRIVLVSFDPLGPELHSGLIEKNDEVLASLAMKMSAGDPSQAEAWRHLLEAIEVETSEEGMVQSDVFDLLRASPGASDPTAALAILTSWLQGCAERRETIISGDLLSVLDSIGRYLSDRRDHCLEWYRSVEPLSNLEPPEGDRLTELRQEFDRGIAARPIHVCVFRSA